jgi:hypothetical protein
VNAQPGIARREPVEKRDLALAVRAAGAPEEVDVDVVRAGGKGQQREKDRDGSLEQWMSPARDNRDPSPISLPVPQRVSR